MPRSLQRAMHGIEILVVVEGDQQQVHAGAKGANGGIAKTAVVGCAHREIVGDEQALVAPFASNHPLHDFARERDRIFGVELYKDDMAEHDRGIRMFRHVLKRLPVVRGELSDRRAQFGGEMVGVLGHATQAGKVLERAANACGFKAQLVSERHLRSDGGVGRDRAFVDAGVEVPAARCAAGAQVDHRAEIERDAKSRERLALLRAVGMGALCEFVVGHIGVEQRGECRLAFDQWRETRNRAAFLVGCDDQRWQAGFAAQCLQALDFIAQFSGRAALYIAAGYEDSADQPLPGQLSQVFRIVVPDDEMRAQRLCERALRFIHFGPVLVRGRLVAQGSQQGRECQAQSDRAQVAPCKPPGDCDAGHQHRQQQRQFPRAHEAQVRVLQVPGPEPQCGQGQPARCTRDDPQQSHAACASGAGSTRRESAYQSTLRVTSISVASMPKISSAPSSSALLSEASRP